MRGGRFRPKTAHFSDNEIKQLRNFHSNTRGEAFWRRNRLRQYSVLIGRGSALQLSPPPNVTDTHSGRSVVKLSHIDWQVLRGEFPDARRCEAPGCGEVFKARRGARACSNKCRQKLYRIRNAIDAELERMGGDGSNRVRAMSAVYRALEEQSADCARCGEQFERTRSDKRYCSERCRKADENARARQRRE